MKLLTKSVLVLLFLAATPFAFADEEILVVGDIRKGMKGYGLTVFEGHQVARFDVEILGVLHNIGPKRDLILARVDSEEIRRSGVIAGMSGSPIYIDGRLIGALAYSWQFSKEPIAGITPIEEMLRLQRDRGSATAPIGAAPAARELAQALASPEPETLQPLFARMMQFPSRGSAGAVPITVPLSFAQFAPQTFERFGSLFEAAGFLPVPTGSSAGSSGVPAAAPVTPLYPGDAFSAILVEGDFSLAATGTVTRVDGEKIFGFGHSFLHMGDIAFPMARSEVVAILPSLAASFKLSNTQEMIGTLVQDRHSGVLGYTGLEPDMIPVELSLMSAGSQQDYTLRVVRHGNLFPLILAMAADSVISMGERGAGERTVVMESAFHLGDGRIIALEEAWTGIQARQAIPLYLAVVSSYLLSNEFEDAGLGRIEIRMRHEDELQTLRLLDATIDAPEDGQVNPGDIVRVRARVQPFREPARVEMFEIEIPASLPPGKAHLFIGSGTALNRLDFGLIPPDPRTLDQVIQVIERLRPSTELAVALYAEAEGIIADGQHLPGLPHSMRAVMSGDGANRRTVKYFKAAGTSRGFDAVVGGALKLDVDVRPQL
ncbi:MAG TPA: SpoIVB peptidase S55 domain-containing protein [Thermoanaerobaculia bacterium]|nr:SpoIVB peptidase S55 domain-containing protein [Thermoanaerobaculia bacterium]